MKFSYKESTFGYALVRFTIGTNLGAILLTVSGSGYYIWAALRQKHGKMSQVDPSNFRISHQMPPLEEVVQAVESRPSYPPPVVIGDPRFLIAMFGGRRCHTCWVPSSVSTAARPSCC